jgi:hypothetical protein
VPQSPWREGQISNETISRETGIPIRVLDGGFVRERVQYWISKIGLGEPETRDYPKSAHERSRIYVHRVDNYLKDLRDKNRRIPEDPAHRGEPHILRVSRASSVPNRLLTRDSKARRRLLEGVAELGLEIYEDLFTVRMITYKELLDVGGQLRIEELRGKPGARQQLYNTKTALRRLIKHVNKSNDDLAGPELTVDFDKTVEEISQGISNIKTRRKFCDEIRRWPAYAETQLGDGDLPLEFEAALDTAMGRAGITYTLLAELVDGCYDTITGWAAGRWLPSKASYPLIRRIEHALRLSPETLTSRIGQRRSKRFAQSDYPEYASVRGELVPVRGNKSLLGSLRPHLPDNFNLIAMAERISMVEWILVNLVGPTSAWGFLSKELIQSRYAMKKLPPWVEEEWQQLASFKCSKISPPGMKRNQPWVSDSEKFNRSAVERIFGALALPKDAEDSRLRGLGLNTETFSLAMLVCPKFLHWWVEWKAFRRLGASSEDVSNVFDGSKQAPPREMYTEYEASVAFNLSSLFDRETGWMSQNPQLAGHLKPIEGFIDKAFIRRALRDWDSVCQNAYDDYDSLGKQIEDLAEQVRDPFEPILPILKSSNPIGALRLFAQNILEDMPGQGISPLQSAVAMRNYLIVRLHAATALRSRNMRELTFKEDNTGQLRREGKRWVLMIPRNSFKNRHSSFFGRKKKSDYRRVLSDIDGLYVKIEEYIAVHRPVLLREKKSDVFIVAFSARPLFTMYNYHRNYRLLTAKYLAHNPFLGRGIPGVRPHGPHVVRDIVATHIIKETGSYELAAYALGDSSSTVKEHYARFMPEDKIHLADRVIDAWWEAAAGWAAGGDE